MHLDRYELRAGRNITTFEFVSEGPKGKIVKVIQFQQMNLPGLYNLAFGDKDSETKIFSDMVVTNNGDSEKVLATVVAAVYPFSERFPGSWVYATGSSPARTRLYRMGVNKYFDLVKADFDILGEDENEWEWYEKGKDYQAFAVLRKTNNIEL